MINFFIELRSAPQCTMSKPNFQYEQCLSNRTEEYPIKIYTSCPIEDLDLSPGPKVVILGEVYDVDLGSNGRSRACNISVDRFDEIIDRGWGAFILIKVDTEALSIYRDPSGLHPLYLYQDINTYIFFSCFQTSAGYLPSLAPDFRELAALLCISQVVTNETPVKNVREVGAGECVRIGRRDLGILSKQVWDPVEFASQATSGKDRSEIALFAEAARATLRRTASASIKTLVELSGGLDSAIVATQVAAKNPEACILVHFFDGTGQTLDERPRARDVARQLNSKLHEVDAMAFIPSVTDVISNNSASIAPRLPDIAYMMEAYIQAYAAETGCDRRMTGSAGDALFWRMPQNKVLDRRTSSSVHLPFALSFERRHLRFLLGEIGFYVPEGLIIPELRPLDALNHPWTSNLAKLPRTKICHVMSILRCLKTYRTCESNPNLPLLTLMLRPLMEACLKTSVEFLAQGGVDRALVRALFRKDLPRSVYLNKEKGRGGQFYKTFLWQNMKEISEVILDGSVANGIGISRKALDSLLEKPLTVSPKDMYFLIGLFLAEVWLINLCWRRNNDTRGL